ncbi:hypothetical protein LOZ65_001414 [Ophidiomyces ophidiicola]|nr:hypothetical protein LOZ65_001414 [Ophidiomyces ophidiicola]
MLLTLKPSSLNRPTNESVPQASSPSLRNLPSAASTPRSSKPSSLYLNRHEQMAPTSAPHDHPADSAHRSLPPPMTMTLPAMAQVPSTVAQLPSSQWQNSEECVRLWFLTKAEEDRRRQEEERTQQESLKLDQRKVEQSMLRDSLQAGVPPYMVPFIFTGLGGGSLQWAQQYISQMSAGLGQPLSHGQSQQYSQVIPAQQQQPRQEYNQLPPQPRPSSQPLPAQPLPQQSLAQTQQSNLEVPRDNRMIPPNPYAASRSVPAVTRPPVQQTPPSPAQSPYTRISPPDHSATVSAAPFSQPTAPLSRINSAEMHFQNPPVSSGARVPSGTSSRTSQQAGSVKQEAQQAQSSPLYFHHWVPPSNPNTPSGKSPNISPNTGHPASHLRSEYQNSPKKRKSQTTHQQVPPPPSHLSDAGSTDPSPARSQQQGRRSLGNSRQRNGSLSQNGTDTAAPQPDTARSSGQMNVSSLVSNDERTTSQSSHRDEPNSATSDHNQHGQFMILGRYRTNRNSSENSVATNTSAGNDASSHRLEEDPRKHSAGSQGASHSTHVPYTNGYHHPNDVSSNISFDSTNKLSHSDPRLVDMVQQS